MNVTNLFYIKDLKKTNIPVSKGVYLFRDGKGKILYIGKARSLRQRVWQYIELHDSRQTVIHLMERVFSLEIILTGSESEALVLESQLIKKNQPPFNINLKDDKSYPHLAITDEKWPRLIITRRPEKKYLYIKGPFTRVSLLHSLKELLQSLYPLKYCPAISPKGCINGQMGLCCAPCQGKEQFFQKKIESIVEILNGRKWDKLSETVKEKIDQAVDSLNFEKAASLRDSLTILPEMTREFGIEFSGKGIEDSFLFKKEGDFLFVVAARYREGKLVFLKTFCEKVLFDSMESCIVSGVASFYQSVPVPQKISVFPDIIELKQLNQAIGQDIEKKVKNKKSVAAILEKNITESIKNRFLKEERISLFKKEFAGFTGVEIVSLQCIDISTFGGEDTVAGVIWWENGTFVKSKYRRYKIKSFEGIDDFKSLREVAARLKKKWDDHSLEKPSIILVDGGTGQVNTMKSVLGKSIEVAGIIKDRNRKKGVELLVNSDGKIMELTDSVTANILKSIRDETHRFSIAYNRTLRKKKLKTSLKDIEGVGSEREKRLLLHFSTIERIKRASIAELASVPGISGSTAQKIYDHYHI